MRPHNGIYPETISHFGLLVKVPSDDLIELLDARLIDNEATRKLKAMCLVELLYRSGIRTQEAYQCAWIAMFGDAVPPPDILEAPSEMNPHSRGWVDERRVARH